MSALERRCQLLLRAYPAAYREVRGEEIIGTLLEVTPPGHSWPLPRDIRGLIVGGLGARAERPRQLTAAANLRVALFAGVVAYLSFSAAAYLSDYVVYVGWLRPRLGWPLAVFVLPLIPMALAWLSRRRVVVLVGALPAAAATCYVAPKDGVFAGTAVVCLVCLAALVALAGYAERPEWRWFWLLALIAIAPLLSAVAGRLTGVYLAGGGGYQAMLLLAIAILAVAWIVIDARPAIAIAVFAVAAQLPSTIGMLAMGGGFEAFAVFTLIVMAILALAVWRLRRQSATGEPA